MKKSDERVALHGGERERKTKLFNDRAGSCRVSLWTTPRESLGITQSSSDTNTQTQKKGRKKTRAIKRRKSVQLTQLRRNVHRRRRMNPVAGEKIPGIFGGAPG